MSDSVKTIRTRAVCALIAGLLFWGLGCEQKSKEEIRAELPGKYQEAAANLTAPSEEVADKVIIHKVEDTTEFPSSVDSLARGAPAPEVRVPEKEATNVIRVEPVPKVRRDSEKKPVEKPIEKDWDGTVLVASNADVSQAFTTDVSLKRIEAHPLQNGALRVWVRVQNETDKDLNSRVACNFKSVSEDQLKATFLPVEIPAGEAIDVYFMSPTDNVIAYTVLVR